MSNQTIFLRMPESEKARFKQWVSSINTESQTQVKREIVNTLEKIASRAKRLLTQIITSGGNITTGALKNSIRTAYSPDKLGGSVYTGRLYAPYVEFGTGDKVVAPPDVADYAWTFKGAGKRKVNNIARPYLFPSVRIGLKEFEMKLEQMGFKKVR